MSEELAEIAHKLLISIVTLGLFCFVNVAYSMFVMISRSSEQLQRESRVRSMMLASVTLLTASIFVLGFDELYRALQMFEGLGVAVPEALKAAGAFQHSIPGVGWWAIAGGLTALSLLPAVMHGDAARARHNKAIAGLNFFLSLLLMLLATALYGAWRLITVVG